jgi:hypothetical protein
MNNWKCEKCGKEDSSVRKYTWMFAKELNRVLTDITTSGTKRTETYSIYRSGFQPVSISLCSGCIKKKKITTSLIPGAICLVLTLISAAIFLEATISQKLGEELSLRGYFGIGAALLFGYLAIDRFRINAKSIALEEATIKANQMGMTINQDERGSIQ